MFPFCEWPPSSQEDAAGSPCRREVRSPSCAPGAALHVVTTACTGRREARERSRVGPQWLRVRSLRIAIPADRHLSFRRLQVQGGKANGSVVYLPIHPQSGSGCERIAVTVRRQRRRLTPVAQEAALLASRRLVTSAQLSKSLPSTPCPRVQAVPTTREAAPGALEPPTPSDQHGQSLRNLRISHPYTLAPQRPQQTPHSRHTSTSPQSRVGYQSWETLADSGITHVLVSVLRRTSGTTTRSGAQVH